MTRRFAVVLAVITVMAVSALIAVGARAADDAPPATIDINGTPYVILPLTEPTATPTPQPTDLALPALASAQTWDEARTIIDAQIDQWVYPAMLARQTALLAAGGYVQMLPSHDGFIPADGQHYYPTAWTDRPTDQSADWRKARLIPYGPMPYQMTIDIYDSVNGPGFVVTLQIRWGGDVWQRAINYGPEILRDSAGWEVMP